MSDELSDADRERNRRLFGQVLAWITYRGGRRPGMIGEAVGFRGTTPDGRGVLNKIDSERWELRSSGSTSALTTADVLRVIGTGGFFPRHVMVVPDLAELLFQEAIHQAEHSLSKVNSAARYVEELRATDARTDPMPWVMATGDLDRSVRASMAAIALAIAAAEAQVNQWVMPAGWQGSEDYLPVGEKCKVLAERVGSPISLGESPYQELHRATKNRNALVHSRPVPQALPVTGSRVVVPGRSLSEEARGTCLAVRQSLVDLAVRLRVEKPKYLAYCPPARPDDDDAWNAATLMTGTRSDPDFPTVSERLDAEERQARSHDGDGVQQTDV